MVKPEDDYRNPMLWVISITSLIVGTATLTILLSVTNPGVLGAGIVPMTTVFMSWVVMWECYKRTDSFRKRYNKT